MLIAVLGTAGYLAYTHQAQVHGIVNTVERKVSPCGTPITYSIGSIDPRFGISKATFASDLKEAEAVWDQPSDKHLFEYQKTDGDVRVNLVYDSRQAAIDRLEAAGIEIDSSETTFYALKARYDTLASQVRSEQLLYESRVNTYQRDQAAYNAEVERANQRGGASQAQYQQLQAEKAALEEEFAGVKSLESAVNADVDILNALATTLNQLIVQLNLNVAQYNRAGAGAGEFEGGLYQDQGGLQTIDIYEYSNHVQLVRVLAHELGHALGLDHVSYSAAIMYKVNRGESLKATAADLDELKSVCASGVL